MSPADATAGDWLAGARRRLADVELAPDVASVGRVLAVADGVARVGGLPDAVLDERLVLEGGRPALVRGLDVDVLTAVLLDDPDGVEAGQRVRATRGVLDVPVGEALLGRVVDPLGRPLDGGPPIDAEGRGPRLPIERAPPPIVDRAPVTTPVHTGVLVVDALLALGRGQRELVVGDRATGKSALALDVLASQRERDVVGVYVAIGQRASAVERAIASLREHGAFERCIVVVAGPSSPAGLRWIAPFAATSMAEHVRDAGGHALVVYDDLSRHAAVHRELALLGDEAPGREAYPGDVFHLHARLLERAACLGAEAGGGSLTALPIAETDAGDLAGYIPTNLVSITDGQIVLDAHRFAAGQRPAVDVGRSVSRIGGKAQGATMRRLAGRLRLDYAQFLELEAFTRFGGLVDERTRTRVARGRCIRALLSQPRFSPLDDAEEIALLAALSAGALDTLPPAAVPTLRTGLREALRGTATSARHPREPGAYDDEHLDELVTTVRALVDGIDGAAASPAEGHP